MMRAPLLLALAAASAAALRLDAVGARGALAGSSPALPAELHATGLKLFGSEEKLVKFAAATAEPVEITIGGQTMRMVANAAERVGPKQLAEHHKEQGLSGLDRLTEKDGVILEVGANIGDLVLFLAKKYPRMQVVAFEPVPPTYMHMLWNLQLNGVPVLSEDDLGKPSKPGVLPLNMAVGDGRDVEIAWKSHSSTSAADSNVNRTSLGPTDGKATIHSLRLQEFLAKRGVKTVRLLHMDCEGCEFMVLPMVKDIVQNKEMVERVSVELHPKNTRNPAWKTEIREIFEKRQKGCSKQISGDLHLKDIEC